MYYFEGIRDDIVVEANRDDGRVYYTYDRDRVDAFMDGIDFWDAHYSARTWVVVMTYLLTDYRYLQL